MKNHGARRVALLGMLAAAAIVLSAVEGALPALPFLPPGAKAGFSNIIVMYLASSVGLPCAVATAVFKAVFALITRGAVAGLMSLCGGVFSAVVLFFAAKGRLLGFIGLGVCGGAAHNLAQLAASIIIIGRAAVAYTPLLLVFGGIAGSVTGAVLWALSPTMERFFKAEDINFHKSEVTKS